MLTKRVVFVGVDPGISGGIGVIDSNSKLIDKFKTPTIQIVVNNKNRNTIDEIKVVSYFKNLNRFNRVIFCLEKVNSLPRDGHVGAFSFGTNYGFWRAIGRSFSEKFFDVMPKKWQNTMLDKSLLLFQDTKKVSVATASEFFLVKLKNSEHGVADALLIAEYSRRFNNDQV